MNNLQISDNDLYGKRFNGHFLQVSLNARGIHSNHIVWRKHSKNNHTFEIIKSKPSLLYGITKFNTDNSLQNTFFPDWITLVNNRHFLDSDVVHYHMLHNASFNLSLLPVLTRLKPSIWTLHDPWALTGHCIHPFSCEKWKTGCGDCPDLDTDHKIKHDLTALNWEMKKSYYMASEFDVIVASDWMFNLAKTSPLLQNKMIHKVPFGLDLNVFKPGSSLEAKKRLGIAAGNLVIGFRASSWKLKGLEYIKETLKRIKPEKPVTLLTFNNKGLVDEFRNRFSILDLGWVDDEQKMVQAYQAVDVFLMPSTAEAFGMMAIEAMACGKPSIVFEGTALTEVIHHPEGGIAVPSKNCEKMANELEKLLNNEDLRQKIGENALTIAKKHYSQERYIDDIINIYQEIIRRKVPDNRNSHLVRQLKKTSEIDHLKETGFLTNKVEFIKIYLNYFSGNRIGRTIIQRLLYPLGRKVLFYMRRKPKINDEREN